MGLLLTSRLGLYCLLSKSYRSCRSGQSDCVSLWTAHYCGLSTSRFCAAAEYWIRSENVSDVTTSSYQRNSNDNIRTAAVYRNTTMHWLRLNSCMSVHQCKLACLPVIQLRTGAALALWWRTRGGCTVAGTKCRRHGPLKQRQLVLLACRSMSCPTRNEPRS